MAGWRSVFRARRIRCAPAVLALLLVACHRDPPPPPASAPAPVFLNAASQDRALYLTWNVEPTPNKLTLFWRAVGAPKWQQATPEDRGFFLIEGLENGTRYQCYGEREFADGQRLRSVPVVVTPRTRRSEWGSMLFTSYAAAQESLRKHNIDPASLRLIGQPEVQLGPTAPDGAYAAPDGKYFVHLHRHLDDVFTPPVAPRSPRDVRTVLTRVLWPTANPFDHPDRFPMPITPIEPPMTGNVRGFATAESFSIAYHPKLASRCTRFVPKQPALGKLAIYIHGHQAPTVRHGAATIDALLDRGWTVIAVDMPLTGANRADASGPLRDHDSFRWLNRDGVTPVALFLQPLKAIIDEFASDDAATTVMLIGKSGGGWTSFMYGALDPRVDYAVSIAGGTPLSLRLREKDAKIGDYEQSDPRVYDAVPYEYIMPVAGSRGAFYVFNANDPCCFRVQPGEPFVKYLEDASKLLAKPVGVYVDTESEYHTFSPESWTALDRFLETTEKQPRRF